MSGNPRTCLMLALMLGITGCAHSPERQLEKYQRDQMRAAEVLRQRSDADSLAAAALLVARSNPADSLELIGHAARAAPDRPEITLLHVQICIEAAECDPRSSEARLRQQDPENGIGWVGDIARAYDAKDDGALDEALAAVGRSKRFNSYFTTLVAQLSEATAHAGAMPLHDAVIAVTGEVAGYALPDFAPVSRGCAAERLQRPGVLASCRSLAESLMAGDTHLAEMIGVAIAKRVWPVDSPEWQAATEARRVYRYRSAAISKLDSDGVYLDEAVAAEYLSLFKVHRREQEATMARLVALGIDPAPPDDWREPEAP